MAIYNLVNDFGAVGNDSDDDITANDTAFSSFRTQARLESSTALIIPTGIYRHTSTRVFDGAKQLIVTGAGKQNTILKLGEASLGLFLATQGGIQQRDGLHAEILEARAGDISVTCITAAQASRFPVGRWVAVTAYEMQGISGYPPNHHYNEFKQIADFDTDTGVVTFTEPLQKSYSQNFTRTWNGTFTGGNYCTGGPATIMLLDTPTGQGGVDTAWGDCDHEYNAFTVDHTTGTASETDHVYMAGRRVVVNDVEFIECAPTPTMNAYAKLHNIDAEGPLVEVDKAIELLEVTGSSVIRNLKHQSSSVELTRIRGSTQITERMEGTPKRLEIYEDDGVTIADLWIGPSGYGNTESIRFIGNPTISAITPITVNRHATSNFTWEPGGSLTFNSSTGGMKFYPPGAQLFLAGQISGGSNHAHIGYPTWVRESKSVNGLAKIECWMKNIPPSFLTGTVYVVQHPCAAISGTPTGSAAALDIARAPDGLPLYSFIRRVDQDFTSSQAIKCWGYLKYIKIDVTRAYTGAQSEVELHIGHVSSGAAGPTIDPDGVTGGYSRFHLHLNTKVAGERIITPTQITGAQSGDELGSAPGEIYFMDTIAFHITDDLSGDTDGQKPLITVEVLTDQFQKVARLI